MLVVKDLQVFLSRNGLTVKVVRKISFSAAAGQILGIVGESGSGKSMTALALTGLLPPEASATGYM
ncbi:MAG: ATP-binding cassette domain-containing protein, partial [Firmicutes bacterium]|nr:ATP-binding cassette domain-containing protein [Bacillota bacterium]